MNIKSKFNLDDKVFIIQRRGENKLLSCPTCKGKGKVTINNTNETITCPSCYGSGIERKWIPEEWKIAYESKIGIIYVEKNRNKNKITYMVDATGIGTGTLWSEENVFATKEEAQKECDIRNNKEQKCIE